MRTPGNQGLDKIFPTLKIVPNVFSEMNIHIYLFTSGPVRLLYWIWTSLNSTFSRLMRNYNWDLVSPVVTMTKLLEEKETWPH